MLKMSKLVQDIRKDIAAINKVTNLPGAIRDLPLAKDDRKHQLSPERELQLTDDLAFLSATSDNPDKIMAVALEEGQDGTSLIIRLSCNTGMPAEVIRGFEAIASLLQDAYQRIRPHGDLVDDMFTTIVQTDVQRILSRLRSRRIHRRNPSRPELMHLLYNELQSLPSTKRQSFKEILNKINAVRDVFGSFEKRKDALNSQQNIARLKDIITGVCEFYQEVPSIFTSISNMNPTVPMSLMRNLEKVARYKLIAQSLLKAAANPRHTIFSQVRIAMVNHLEYGMPAVAGDGRVHAEVQILCFYQLNPLITAPRVICSNKDACFLCELFIRCHGRFTTPRTHGRLYTKWTLPRKALEGPSADSFREAILIFNRHLHTIAESVRGQKSLTISRCPPNESTTIIYRSWSPCKVPPQSSNQNTPIPCMSIESLNTPPIYTIGAGTKVSEGVKSIPNSSGTSPTETRGLDFKALSKWQRIISPVPEGGNSSVNLVVSKTQTVLEWKASDDRMPDETAEYVLMAFHAPYCDPACIYRSMPATVDISNLGMGMSLTCEVGSAHSDEFITIAGEFGFTACKFFFASSVARDEIVADGERALWSQIWPHVREPALWCACLDSAD